MRKTTLRYLPEVRGRTVAPLNRPTIYYDDVHNPPAPSMLRRMCIMGLADGRVLVKELRTCTKRGYYHLLSNKKSMIEDQRVEWAVLNKSLVPR